MKKPSQRISFDVPNSGHLRSACHLVASTHQMVENCIPPSLHYLAHEVIRLQLSLEKACQEYDYWHLSEKQKVVELNRQETADLIILERQRKCAAEVQKSRKKEVSSLRGLDKRFVKETGLTPKEYQEQMMAEFKKFLEGK